MCDKCQCTCSCKPEPKKIDWNKPIRTRAGLKANYLGTLNRSDEYRFAIAVPSITEDHQTTCICDEYGTSPSGLKSSSVENVPEKMVRPVYYIRWKNGYGRSTFTENPKNSEGFTVLRLISETSIAESDAQKMGYKEWVDA